MTSWRSRTWLLGLLGVFCIALVFWFSRRATSQDLSARWISVETIRGFEVYTDPGDRTPDIGDYSAYLPALPPPLIEFDDEPEPVVVEEPIVADWRVSAIVIGSRPVAIVDGERVVQGDRLEDGTLIEQISPQQVTVVDRRGNRHVLGLGQAN